MEILSIDRAEEILVPPDSEASSPSPPPEPPPDSRVQLQSTIAKANPVPDHRPLDPAEIEKLRAGWQREQRAIEREHNHRRAELIRMRSQLHMAQQALEQETRGRQFDAAQYSSRVALLERQVADSNAAKVESWKAQSKERGTRLRLSAAAATAAAILGAIVVWTQFPSARAAAVANAPASVAPTPAEIRSLPVEPVRTASATQSLFMPEEGFPRALSRLNDALATHTKETPETVLEAVRIQNKARDPDVCAFQWNHGQPALVYTGHAGLTLSASLTRCAEAVERLKQ